MLTAGATLQIWGGILAIAGSIIIGYGGLPSKKDVRAHGTYGGARAIWRAMGRQYGYTFGGLVLTVIGAVLVIVGLGAWWGPESATRWSTPVLLGIALSCVAFVITSAYASRVANEWENMP